MTRLESTRWMGSRALYVALLFLFTPVVAQAGDELRVVTTTPDLADVARQIGGSRVAVTSLTKGTEDFHAVRPRPRLLVKLSRADVLVQMGLDLEHAWLPALVKTSRNPKIAPGVKGLVNASRDIVPLEVPVRVTRKEGPDAHPQGNPHYNLNPRNLKIVAQNVLDGLVLNAPAHEKEFRQNHARFVKALEERLADWDRRMKALEGAAFVEYHASWTYLAREYGLRIVARLEPKPGVSPSPQYLAEVIEIARQEKVGIIVARPANIDVAKKVAKEIGARAVVLPLSSTTEGEYAGYFQYMERVVSLFEKNLKK